MIPYFYGQADSLLLSFPSFFHSFSASTISKLSFNFDQQWNDCLALLIFLVTSLSTAVVMETAVCVCVRVCVFQSIPKAEQFITQTKPTGKRVLCCVCVLLPSVLSTHLYLHTSQPFHIFFPLCQRMCVIGPLISPCPTSATLRWMSWSCLDHSYNPQHSHVDAITHSHKYKKSQITPILAPTNQP